MLAAIAYGESSTANIFEEMVAIASATIRVKNAWHVATVAQLIKKRPDFIKAVKNANERYRKVMCSSRVDYLQAYEAARNALYGGKDYAEGGCFWDGVDLKTEGSNHYRYEQGFKFTNPQHNLFKVKEPPPSKIEGEFSNYYYIYDSTAAYGKTIFWKYSQGYLKGEGAKQCG